MIRPETSFIHRRLDGRNETINCGRAEGKIIVVLDMQIDLCAGDGYALRERKCGLGAVDGYYRSYATDNAGIMNAPFVYLLAAARIEITNINLKGTSAN